MKKLLILISLSLFLFSSCDRVKNKTKETINKGGEVVGKTATEFIEGVSEGVDKTLECEINIAEALKNKGITTGKFSIESDPNGGTNNKLTIYLIFNKDISTSLTAKAFDKKNLEVGRAKIKVDSKAGDAGYYDFVFDERTYVEVRSKINIE